MSSVYKRRRFIAVLILTLGIVVAILTNTSSVPSDSSTPTLASSDQPSGESAIATLDRLAIKGRAPKTDYSREQFGNGWVTTNGCDTRNIILNRDLIDPIVDPTCNVLSGTLHDPYTGKTIAFKRGTGTSSDVQIDHVVALSDAWQKGAQQLSKDQRIVLANDPLELLAVDGPANQQKSDGDAASWLPSYKPFRCQYVARQIAVKLKYALWVTQPEKEAMRKLLDACPTQLLPVK